MTAPVAEQDAPVRSAVVAHSSWDGWHRFGLLWVLALLLLGGVAAVVYVARQDFAATMGRVRRLDDAIAEMSKLMGAVSDLEAGQRGFLLTGEKAYLAPYRAALDAMPAHVERIDALLAPYPDERRALAALREQLALKQNELAATLTLYDGQGREAALALVRTDYGKQVMDAMRVAGTRLDAALQARVREEEARLDELVAQRNVTIYLALALAVAASAGGIVLLRRHVRALRHEERLRAQAQQSRRESREKSAFLANMSHEIRTPMNAIFGFSQLLAERVTDPVDRRYVDAILTSGRSLLALINDILDLSKIEAGKLDVKPAPMSPRETAASVASVFAQLAAERGLALATDVDANVPDTLMLDAGRVRQVLFNLVGNAVKYTDRGRVTLRVRATPRADDDTRVDVAFEVEDTGIGIAPEDLERIFDPFTQGRDTGDREGTGLGLSITRRLVRLMGGEIAVDSALGRGSRFRIELPSVPLAVRSETDAAMRGKLADLPRASILIVDDVELNRRLLEAMLAGSRHAIASASSGAEAIDRAHAIVPDVILLDLRMPGMDGFETLGHLRADPALARTAIVAITASSLAGEDAALRERFDGYIRKPITQEALFAELSRLLLAGERGGKIASERPASREPVDPAEAAAAAEALAALQRDGWGELVDTMSMRDLGRFVERVRAIGSRARVEAIDAFADDLDGARALFDLAKLERLLRDFPHLIDAVRRVATERGTDVRG